MEDPLRPDLELALRVLPAGLMQALSQIFAEGLPGCGLVGGSALSGFYAGHRRSDDLDLICADKDNFKAAGLAVRRLPIEEAHSSASYLRANCSLAGHDFTIDLVLDSNLFAVGRWHELGQGLRVASLETILMCKAGTLVSRASEKDLYDLIWLFEHREHMDLTRLMELGQRIDAGLDAESALLSLSGAILKEEACGFALDGSPAAKEIFEGIKAFRRELIRQLKDLDRVETPLGLAEIVRRIQKAR